MFLFKAGKAVLLLLALFVFCFVLVRGFLFVLFCSFLETLYLFGFYLQLTGSQALLIYMSMKITHKFFYQICSYVPCLQAVLT